MKTDEKTAGRATVSIETTAPPTKAFAALVDSERLACWFGTPTVPMTQAGNTRIEFGDGDFFDVESIEIDAPRRLRYAWRFLGLSPRNLIGWTVKKRSRGGGSVITVTDDCENRSVEGVAEMVEGWTDFTDRLKRYLETGERTRYDWRRDLDGGVELPVGVAEAAAKLLSPDALRAWQPWHSAELAVGTQLRVEDGLAPAALEVTEVDRSTQNEIRFGLTAAEWRRPTHCSLALRSRDGATVLRFSHSGWEEIGGTAEEQHRQRERFCHHWVEGMKRARELVVQR